MDKTENTPGKRKKEFLTFIIASVVIGFLCAALANSLKKLTEYYETFFYSLAEHNRVFFLLFPLIGLSLIFFLHQYLFKKKENKGIKEILNSLKTRHNELPIYKIPSHYINGLLTVAFGGSTGIEVSAVVASATIGSVTQREAKIHVIYRKELIAAGVASGVAALFGSPLAGILFALEVISKKISTTSIISIVSAVSTACLFNLITKQEPLFQLTVNTWHVYALPYFMLLGVLGGLNSVYLTKCVLFFKAMFSKIKHVPQKIIMGSVIISTALLFFPALYGEGYHAMRALFAQPQKLSNLYILTLLGILIFKPLITSVTLASGGDGGIFAPSLFIGAFLGLFAALILNQYFNANVIPINFMVAGMAAVLSASLHAPFTAIFLVCGLVGNFTLVIPIITVVFVARLMAKALYPYTVYSYPGIK